MNLTINSTLSVEELMPAPKSPHKYTLREWQHTQKPKKELIFNASECKYRNDQWIPFTIGIAVWYAKSVPDDRIGYTQIGTHQNLLHCSISTVTDRRRRPYGKNRASIVQTLAKNGFQNVTLEHSDYFESLPKYKFVISPEGNGIDCHRHYEALMAGCIPIIENHPGIAEKYRGCPILFTDDYSEINEEYLTQKYAEMLDNTYDFSKLFMSSYDENTQAEIRKNGNFWGKQVLGIEWYR